MRLKTKYTIESQGDTLSCTHWKDYEVGSKLVGIVYKGNRPSTVELNKEELQYLMDNLNYMKHLKGALK